MSNRVDSSSQGDEQVAGAAKGSRRELTSEGLLATRSCAPCPVLSGKQGTGGEKALKTEQ